MRRPVIFKVNDPRNSTVDGHVSTRMLRELDWDNWFTDSSYGGFYLHVFNGTPQGDGAIHRVRCRKAKGLPPRIRMRDGELEWIIDD